MKRIFTMLMVCAMLISMTAGCTPSTPPATTSPPTTAPQQTTAPPPASKVLTTGFSYDATTMDVHKCNDDGSYTVLNMIGEGLTRNDDGFVSPGVAERWEISTDNLTYTFYLRKNATWSDGSPLNAYDFEYSFRRIIDPEQGFRQATGALQQFKNAQAYFDGECGIEDVGIKAIDEYTLEVVLENATLDAIYGFSGYARFPVNRAYVEEYGDAYGTEAHTVLTNGPFILTDWRHEDRHIMVKNENYWNKDAVMLDGFERRVNVTGNTAVDMMLVGDIDIMSFSNYDLVTSLQNGGMEVIPYVSGYQFVHFNYGGSSEQLHRFMSNTNFRRALNFTINREALAASVIRGATPTFRMTAPSVVGVNGLFHDEYPYQGWPMGGDTAKAKEALALALEELGATVDDIPELSLLASDAGTGILVFQAIQDMLLNTLGIKAKIDPQPVTQMLEKAYAGEWDMWWGGRSLGNLDWLESVGVIFDDTDPAQTNNYYHEGFSDLYHRARTAATMKERKDLLFEIEKIVCEDPCAALVSWSMNWVVQRPGITGLGIVSGLPNYTYLDID